MIDILVCEKLGLNDGNLFLYFYLLLLQVRVQAIRGLPLFCKDTPEYLPKIIDILAQLLVTGTYLFF